MKKQVIDFYRKNGIPISLLIDKRRHNTTPEQIEAASVLVYEEIQSGLDLDNREIPRYIFRKAVGLKGDQYRKEKIQIQNYERKVTLLARAYKKKQREIDQLKYELTRLKSLPVARELRTMRIIFWCLWAEATLYAILRITGVLL